ncbi:MAG: DNA topoisomerase III, partial [Halomonadaceae bacterium]|nr:DNA topoisomerase III [Halomonadaceae bacterium]
MNIARYVDDPAVRRTLREHDGLGTEATRAGIIETLIERGYLTRQNKALRATRLGNGLIASLPQAVSRPERTALWEQRLGAIAEQDDDPQPFLAALVEDLRTLLHSADAEQLRQAMAAAKGEAVKPATPRRSARKRRGSSTGTQRRTARKPRQKA